MSTIADFLAPPASNVRVTSKVDVLDHASLSQAFVRFLEEESQPKPTARLPAVKMAEETEQRAKNKVGLELWSCKYSTFDGTMPCILVL